MSKKKKGAKPLLIIKKNPSDELRELIAGTGIQHVSVLEEGILKIFVLNNLGHPVSLDVQFLNGRNSFEEKVDLGKRPRWVCLKHQPKSEGTIKVFNGREKICSLKIKQKE